MHSKLDFVQVSLEAGLESSLAALDLGEGGGRNRWVGLLIISQLGKTKAILTCDNRRPVAAMDDMLYGSGGENIQSGELSEEKNTDASSAFE